MLFLSNGCGSSWSERKKERKKENLPVYSVGDSAFQASMINENVPWNREKRV